MVRIILIQHCNYHHYFYSITMYVINILEVITKSNLKKTFSIFLYFRVLKPFIYEPIDS